MQSVPLKRQKDCFSIMPSKHISLQEKKKNILQWYFIESKQGGWHPVTSVFIYKSIITEKISIQIVCIHNFTQDIFKSSILAASLVYFHLKTVNKSLLFLLVAFPATQMHLE